MCLSAPPPPGDYSYLGTTLRQNDIEPMPSLSDVRQVLALYGVLPLGEGTAGGPPGPGREGRGGV